MSPRPVIIDCDPGHDDALAILLALGSPDELDVRAITVVAGNVPLALTEKNARKICELAGRTDLPVHAGCARPLVRELVTAEYVHGKTGLDGPALPEPGTPLAAAMRSTRSSPCCALTRQARSRSARPDRSPTSPRRCKRRRTWCRASGRSC